MLHIYQSMADLPFGKLVEIYTQADRDHQGDNTLMEEQETLDVQEFYAYLRQCFFTLPSARYFVWEEQGRVVSAVRCEGYRDGILLTALQTESDFRRRGYATRLLQSVLRQLGKGRIYAHIRRENQASVSVHLHCGFMKIKTGARLLDGSYSSAYDTYMVEIS